MRRKSLDPDTLSIKQEIYLLSHSIKTLRTQSECSFEAVNPRCTFFFVLKNPLVTNMFFTSGAWSFFKEIQSFDLPQLGQRSGGI